MLALAAPFLGFLLGVCFAWLGRQDAGAPAGEPSGPGLWVTTLFGAVIFAPAAGYFLAFSPDWSFAYFVDTATLPRAVEMMLVLVDAASVPLGFAAASRAAATRRHASLVRLAAGPAIVVLALFIASLRRISVYATYAQYHGDFGVEPVTGSQLGYALLWVSVVVSLAAAWTVRVLRRFNPSGARD